VLILFMEPLAPIVATKLALSRSIEIAFFETSFKPYGLKMISDSAFLNRVISFGKSGKDLINEETIELLSPMLDLEGTGID